MSTVTHGTIPEITLGWRLQLALGEMKVQEMADTLGVNRATIGRWMHDRGARPKRAYLLQWAMMTGVDVHWLETGYTPVEPDGGEVVRPQGLEPRTRWFGASPGHAAEPTDGLGRLLYFPFADGDDDAATRPAPAAAELAIAA